MESLAQELLDAIIDHVPSPNARFCSLVARRWRKRSQQRHLRVLVFSCENDLARWCRNIPQDPDGIPSYVQDVLFRRIGRWSDPAILVRVLKCLSRVKILKFFETLVPCGEVQAIASSGAFGRELTSLVFIYPYSALSTLMPLISSPPNLRELRIQPSLPGTSMPLAPEHVHIWKREPLQSLLLWRFQGEEAEYIARCGITARKLDLSMGDEMMEKIIACSSEVVEELVLRDVTRVRVEPPTALLPPLPALTTMEVAVHPGYLTEHFPDFLSCIHSAPALSSVIFRYEYATTIEDTPQSRKWADVDKGLARLAMQVKTKRSLTVVLMGWKEENSEWEEYLPEFRKTGGQVNVAGGI